MEEKFNCFCKVQYFKFIKMKYLSTSVSTKPFLVLSTEQIYIQSSQKAKGHLEGLFIHDLTRSSRHSIYKFWFNIYAFENAKG